MLRALACKEPLPVPVRPYRSRSDCAQVDPIIACLGFRPGLALPFVDSKPYSVRGPNRKPISCPISRQPGGSFGLATELIAMALVVVPPPPNDKKRVKVYELRNGDWFDRGTGFCTGRVVNVRHPI